MVAGSRAASHARSLPRRGDGHPRPDDTDTRRESRDAAGHRARRRGCLTVAGNATPPRDPNDNDDDVDEDEEDEDQPDGPAISVRAGRKLANQSKLVAANLC